jgi:hypothetical protein
VTGIVGTTRAAGTQGPVGEAVVGLPAIWSRHRAGHDEGRACGIGLQEAVSTEPPLNSRSAYHSEPLMGAERRAAAAKFRSAVSYGQSLSSAASGQPPAARCERTRPMSESQVREQDVREWIVWLLERYSNAYVSNQFRALRQFFKWLAAGEEIPDPMARLRPPHVPDRPAQAIPASRFLPVDGTLAGTELRETFALTYPKGRSGALVPGEPRP